MGKAKLISSSEGSKKNPEGKWYIYDEIKPFIRGIKAGELNPDQVSSTLISGVPTPWARVKLFWFAFDYLQHEDPNITTSGLIDFYRVLCNEWKGLIALMALYPDRVSFSEPIYMDPKNTDLFDLTNGFGRMLFDDQDIWTDLTKPDGLPYIQLLRYSEQVIGGTSPFSIVFPGVEYDNLKCATDIPWYRNGKFDDPMRFLDKDKLQKLYLFIKNINNNFADYEKNINLYRNDNPLDFSGLKKFLRSWQDEIKSKGTLQENGTVAKYPSLDKPYQTLLDSKQMVFQLMDGSFTFNRPSSQSDIKETLSDLQNILKDDKIILGWYESPDYKQPLSKSAVYYLQVNDINDTENPIKYFALPLSMEGVLMFSQQLNTLVSHRDPKFDIVGKISDQGHLIVDLTVKIDNQPYRLNSKEYQIEWMTLNNKVIMWPNFISANWNAYYLYTEYPLNVPGIKFVPFFKRYNEDEKSNKILTVKRLDGVHVVYSNSEDSYLNDCELDITSLIKYPVGQVSNEMHKYEVIKSNCPIEGLEIRIENAGKKQIGGYLIVKSDTGDDDDLKIHDYSTENSFQEAVIGIDFGSNNSCAYYLLQDNKPRPIQFNNRRLSLVGIESKSGIIAEKDELLFFSNEPTPNGQVKSWLHEHDSRYSEHNEDKEIAGGVAVNEKNILVKEMNNKVITTQAGILHYNMKWLSDKSGLSQKTAYLKALWLSICADLYANKYSPSELRWSYPGSMSSYDKNQYNLIYTEMLPMLTPFINVKTRKTEGQTESEAVCKYALSKDLGLTESNMFIGIDVGGSTSDILLLAKDINSENKPRLFSQSSVRLAAGVFFDAVIKSPTFRKAIYEFHESQKRIHVENIKEILLDGQKAPFYLNCVFDQLTQDDFGVFYSYIGREASFVYSIPAYVTGLLVFYSGKLCAKTIQENNLSGIEVHLLPFGKGGRLFYWLQTQPGSTLTNQYYEDCFKKGYGSGADKIKLKYRDDIAKENKSEVAMGLVSAQDLVLTEEVRNKSDIFAEKGIKFLRDGLFEDVKEDDIIANEYFENIDRFEFPQKLENFEDFLRIYIDFVGNKSGLVRNTAALENKSDDLAQYLSAFIKNDAEYNKAKQAKNQNHCPFEYRFPILIAEGLCFLEKILIPELFKS